MSTRQPAISPKNLELLEQHGFKVGRVNGSHHRMKNDDGRITTIPVHKNDDLPKGLLRRIVREDLKIEMEEFETLLKKKK